MKRQVYMVDLPQRKVGIVACSGEELPEGTVTRLAALQVLEQLRPGETVTICLPLFLAGGEGDRAFARFYPTIAIDGCELRCAAKATEIYSSKPAASLVVSEIVAENQINKLEGFRKLNQAGLQAVEITAERTAMLVEELLHKSWSRQKGTFATPDGIEATTDTETVAPMMATCSCGSGIPVQKVMIAGQVVDLVGLPLILQQFRQEGKSLEKASIHELLEFVKIYNPVPIEMEPAYEFALRREYEAFCQKEQI